MIMHAEARRFEMTAPRLTPFEVGQIVALHRKGYAYRIISESIIRSDPEAPAPSFGAIGQAIRRWEADPSWTGERARGSGRPRKTTATADARIVESVKKWRGKRKMTSTMLRRMEPAAKTVSPRTLRRRLNEAELHWFRRRRKTLVPESAVQPRLQWAAWILSLAAPFLKRFVFTDGVAFYLDRSQADFASSQRAALGLYVWRQADKRDALYQDCVAPSTYRKAQGPVVRVWGLLHKSQLRIRVLEARVRMNRWEYEYTVRTHFQKWLAGARWPVLVQDNEKSLWCAEPQAALQDLGIQVCTRHPAHSADLNPIENVWALLRDRLADTAPAHMEDRDQFIARLRLAVAWINRNKKAHMQKLAGNLKQRARDVNDNEGHRTGW